MSTSGIATIDPKTQGPEVDKLYSPSTSEKADMGRKKFLNEMPRVDYTMDTSNPDKLESEICRKPGREKEYHPQPPFNIFFGGG
jgi:hypothetical protein